MKDEIIEEIRAVRRQIMAECGNDIGRYVDFLREKEEELRKQGHVFADPPRARLAESQSLILREDPKK